MVVQNEFKSMDDDAIENAGSKIHSVQNEKIVKLILSLKTELILHSSNVLLKTFASIGLTECGSDSWASYLGVAFNITTFSEIGHCIII